MNHRSAILFTVVLAASCAVVAGQGGYRKFVSEEHGFQLKVPRFVEQQPLEPMEEQILAKFQGSHKANVDGRTRELELILLVIRIRKAEGPITGGKPDEESEPEMVSLRGQSRAWHNGGQSIEEFLKRRGWVNQKRDTISLKKAPQTADGKDYEIFEASANRGSKLGIRAFTVPDAGEIFGVVALGVDAVEVFHPQILRSVRSLTKIDATGASAESGLYDNTDFSGAEHRAAVRRKLAEGWTAHDTEDFILVTNVRNKRLISKLLEDLQIMRDAYTERFPPIGDMDQVSTVRVCGSYEDYMRYGSPDGTAGYWQPLDEELVLFDPGKRIPKAQIWLKEVKADAVLYHEAMHQYLHYANGHVPPASWFNEGYGEVFGGAKVSRSRGEITKIDKNRSRMPWIKQSQKQKAWPDLRILLEMSQREFYGPSALQNYAMGWAFCYFLEDERDKPDGKRNDQWAAIPDAYLQNLRKATEKHMAEMPMDAPRDWIMAFTDEIQAEAFEKTFGGIDLPELEKAWIAAMRRY